MLKNARTTRVRKARRQLCRRPAAIPGPVLGDIKHKNSLDQERFGPRSGGVQASFLESNPRLTKSQHIHAYPENLSTESFLSES